MRSESMEASRDAVLPPSCTRPGRSFGPEESCGRERPRGRQRRAVTLDGGSRGGGRAGSAARQERERRPHFAVTGVQLVLASSPAQAQKVSTQPAAARQSMQACEPASVRQTAPPASTQFVMPQAVLPP